MVVSAMPRYNYGYVNPMEQYQDSAFDPLTGRLNGGQLVMQVINEIAARKKQKQQEGWEVEDRELNKRYREAQMANLYETPAGPQETEFDKRLRLFREKPDEYKAIYGEKGTPTGDQYEIPDEDAAKIEKHFKLPAGSLKKASPDVKKAYHARYLDIVSPKPTSKPTLGFDTAYQYIQKINGFYPRIAAERTRLETDLEKIEKEYNSIKNMPSEKKKKSARHSALEKSVGEMKARQAALSELESKLRAAWSSLRAGQPLTMEDADFIEKMLSTDLVKVGQQKSKAEALLPEGATIDIK